MFHISVLGFPVRPASVTKKPGKQKKNLDAQIPGGEQICNLKQPRLDKEKSYFVVVNNQEEYFRGHGNICFMVFPNNMLTSHIVFNVPLDLIDDQYYLLHIKTTNFCFIFVLVIGNPIIFD